MNRWYLRETLNLTKPGSLPSEFAQLQRLDQNELNMETVGAAFESQEEVKQLLEQRIAKAVAPVAQSLLADFVSEQDPNQIKSILKNITTKIPSVKIQQYFRAGKNYFTIDHQMGHAGNMLFKVLFDMVFCKNQELYHLAQGNRFSIICRI